jgi:hypothetical protein
MLAKQSLASRDAHRGMACAVRRAVLGGKWQDGTLSSVCPCRYFLTPKVERGSQLTRRDGLFCSATPAEDWTR